MSHLVRLPRKLMQRRHGRGRQSIVVLLVLLLLWSICLGWGLATATEPRPTDQLAQNTSEPKPDPGGVRAVEAIGTVDVVPERQKLGQSLYLENCATCHIALPPAIMPTQTWQQLLQDSQHYGVQITPLRGPSLQLLWDYVRTYSRPLNAEEEVPYRIYQSRFFKILHPRVKLSSRPNLGSCVSCHPGAGKYDFRSLTSEWQNAP